MKSTNTAKDISTIGCCLKRRMSADKFRATWGWGSSWVMNLLGCSSECFWQNFMLVTLWVSRSKMNKCHQNEKNMWRAFFLQWNFCSKAWQDLGFFPYSKSWQNCRRGMTLPFTRAAEQPEATTYFSANLYLNTHPLNYLSLQHGGTLPVLKRMTVYFFGSICSAFQPHSYFFLEFYLIPLS